MPKTASINLLSQDDLSSSSLGKISIWALSIGRWIVIITELIVIAAFLSRFKLDRDIANLTEDLNQKSAVVKAYERTEKSFRQTQTRLQSLNQAVNKQINHNQLLEEIGNSVPNDINVTLLTIKQDQISLKALALTENGMAGMKQKLESSPLFKQVNLTRFSVDEGFDTGIAFEIQAQINT